MNSPGDSDLVDLSDATSVVDRAEALLEEGQHDRAIAILTEASGRDPTQAYLYLGIVLCSRAEYAAAVADLTEAIRLDSTSATAFAWRGVAFFELTEIDNALADYAQAIRLDPGNASYYEDRGNIHLTVNELDNAIADYTHAIRLDPGNASYYEGRGNIHLTAKDYYAAIADYNEAILLDASFAVAFRLRGQALYDVREYDDALVDLNRAIELDASDSMAFLARGMVLQALSMGDSAFSDYTEAIRLDPGAATAYWWRGDLWCERGQFREAVADFTEAIRLNPDDESGYRGRAEAWDNLGETDKAEADLEAAFKLSDMVESMTGSKSLIYSLLSTHFEPTQPDALNVTERRYPGRVRADLQRAVDDFLENLTVLQFCGVRKQYAPAVEFTDLLVRDRNDPPLAIAPQYEELDIGEEEPVRCLKSGLWLLEDGGSRFAVFLEPSVDFNRTKGVRFQVATINDATGTRITQSFFRHLEEAVRLARSYRGKILSLESEESYSGVSTGIKVHKLHRVEREQVILPRQTLDLLDRNIIHFVRQRPQLAAAGMATKKGLLFYGPPGTGKTHTLHYLAGALEGTTTLLISAEQIGALWEYMTLARLLQPSMVVIEDADLIARDRTTMGSVCEEVMLNKLLNEMDGLKEDADILFILTTNRPEALEAALASRPGRIDQAIEFTFPDSEGRAKLVRLYARGARLSDKVVQATVKKTENVSAAFIKELMRRAMQFRLERNGSTGIVVEDVDNALEELLFRGGTLNRKLLGGQIEEAVSKSE